MEKELRQLLIDNDLEPQVTVIEENNLDRDLLSELTEPDYIKLGITGEALQKMLKLFSPNYKEEISKKNPSLIAENQVTIIEPLIDEFLPVHQKLLENDLAEYISVFDKHKLNNFDVVSKLTENDLSELGITAIGDRKKIKSLFEIKDVKDEDTNNVIVTQTVHREKTNGWAVGITVVVSLIIIGVIIYYAIPWWWRY